MHRGRGIDTDADDDGSDDDNNENEENAASFHHPGSTDKLFVTPDAVRRDGDNNDNKNNTASFTAVYNTAALDAASLSKKSPGCHHPFKEGIC